MHRISFQNLWVTNFNWIQNPIISSGYLWLSAPVLCQTLVIELSNVLARWRTLRLLPNMPSLGSIISTMKIMSMESGTPSSVNIATSWMVFPPDSTPPLRNSWKWSSQLFMIAMTTSPSLWSYGTSLQRLWAYVALMVLIALPLKCNSWIVGENT